VKQKNGGLYAVIAVKLLRRTEACARITILKASTTVVVNERLMKGAPMWSRRRNVMASCLVVAIVFGITTTTSVMSGAATTAERATKSTIVLGNVGDYTGAYASATVPARQALMVWAKWTNAHGGLNGHPVKVISMDDAGDASQSLTDVKTLVEQDHVLAFVDNELPTTLAGDETYLAQQEIPTIGGDLSSPEWFSDPYLFPQGTSLLPSFTASLKEGAVHGLKKMGILYCAEDPECQELSQLLGKEATSYGVTAVYSGSYSLTNPSFTAQCLEAKKSGAQYLLLLGGYPSLKAAATNCSQQGYNPIWGSGSAGTQASMVSDSSFQDFIGIQGVFPWVDSYTKAQKEFHTAMKQDASGVQLSGYSALGWAGAEILTAVSGDLTAKPTTSEILQGLSTIKNDTFGGLTPPLTFNANAAPAAANCYYVLTIKKHHFVDPYNGKYRCVS
jgi:branched-chain amino acid transport system substrate-binding protein